MFAVLQTLKISRKVIHTLGKHMKSEERFEYKILLCWIFSYIRIARKFWSETEGILSGFRHSLKFRSKVQCFIYLT